MGRQVHFVVAVDLDTQEWWVDDDTFKSLFHEDEGTWNEDTQSWEETTWDDNIKALDILRSTTKEKN